MFREWFETFFRPIAIRNYRGNFGKGILNVLVAGAIGGAVLGFFVALLAGVAGSFIRPVIGMATGAAAFFYTLIAIVIGAILGLIICSAILLLFAKIFKGQGSYAQQTFALSLPTSALLLIDGVVGWVPIFGIPIISVIAGLYYLYPLTIVLRETHRYSTGRAVLTWLIPAIIIFVIYAILIAIFAAQAGLFAAFAALRGIR
jgi:hypothetical protein